VRGECSGGRECGLGARLTGVTATTPSPPPPPQLLLLLLLLLLPASGALLPAPPAAAIWRLRACSRRARRASRLGDEPMNWTAFEKRLAGTPTASSKDSARRSGLGVALADGLIGEGRRACVGVFADIGRGTAAGAVLAGR
jgi:hypothetical protein